MIKLYLYRLGGFLNKAALSSRTERNRLISKTAYELLANKISELTDEAAVIKKTDRGKPYIENLPYYISISHCDDAIFFAVSDGEIGVDIESPRGFSHHAEKRLFSENEISYISNGERNFRSTVLWTMREAVCKATGEGFSDWFFNCELVDSEGILCSRYNIFNIRVFEIDSYICTIATVSPLDDIELSDCTY